MIILEIKVNCTPNQLLKRAIKILNDNMGNSYFNLTDEEQDIIYFARQLIKKQRLMKGTNKKCRL